MGIEPRFYVVEKEGPIIIWKFSNPPKNLATIETGVRNWVSWWRNLTKTTSFGSVF
ncbi:MAG: hypothetical protein JRI85_00490 [Deltaproteobacteria bacterium]|nr:hypothetical protein [Deltaproteobacteria bacterium]